MTGSKRRAGDQKGNSSIATHGRKAAAAKVDNTHARIETAKRAIEKDIERNDGIYPHATGKVTAAEVLRRAGLDTALLQKDRHRNLRIEVNAWVKSVHVRLRRGAKVIRKAVTERVDAARSEADEIRQRWTEAELVYNERGHQLAKLMEENALLKARIR